MTERLESRIAPAGIIKCLLVGASLLIEGDAMDNEIQITPLGGGDYLLEGLNGTLLDTGNNPVPSLVLSDLPVLSLSVNLKEGNDQFLSSGMRVTGATTIDLGPGNDTLALGNHIGLGPVTITGGDGNDNVSLTGDYFVARAKFTLTDGSGVTNLTVDAPTATFGAVQWTLGDGNHQFLLTSAILRAGAVSASFGEGATLLRFANLSTTLASLKVSFADSVGGPNIFQINSTHFSTTGSLEVTSLGGDFSMGTTPVQSLRVGGAFKVTGASGADSIYLDIVDWTVRGATTIQLGDGANIFSVIASTQGDVTLGGDVTWTAGAGADVFRIFGGTVALAKKFQVSLGEGDNQANLNGTILSIKGATTYAGGNGPDAFGLSGDLRAGPINAQMGSGNDSVAIDGASGVIAALSAKFFTQAGETSGLSIFTRDLALKKATVLTTGAGYTTATFGMVDSIMAIKDFTYTGGPGKDVVNFPGAELRTGKIKMDGGEGEGSLTLSASLLTSQGVRYRGGSGADTISISAASGLLGLVDINPGGGSNSILLGGGADPLRVAAINLTATTAGSLANVTLSALRVAGAVNAKFGDGSDVITCYDNVFGGAVSLQTGDGADSILIDSDNFGVPSLFRGAVNLALGKGDDAVTIGDNSTGGSATFKKLLTIDAGEGNDTTALVTGRGNVFAVAPVIKNSEAAS